MNNRQGLGAHLKIVTVLPLEHQLLIFQNILRQQRNAFPVLPSVFDVVLPCLEHEQLSTQRRERRLGVFELLCMG